MFFRKTCFSPSRIVTFLPVQKSFVPAGPKCDVFWEGCDQKRHKLKNIFSYARASHSSQKCDKSNASRFLSPKKSDKCDVRVVPSRISNLERKRARIKIMDLSEPNDSET